MNRCLKQFKISLLMLFACASALVVNAQNILTNGDFTAGNTGFTTDYRYYSSSYNLQNAGVYIVSENAHTYHNDFFNLTDHTSGTGKYFAANGDGFSHSGYRVWSQTVTVQPHSYYDFSFWATHLTNGGGNIGNFRTKLRAKINDAQVGSDFVPTFVNGQGCWTQFPTYRWYSGNQTQATIVIYDVCNMPSNLGDDFGLDDIVFDYKYTNVVTAVDDYITCCFEESVQFDPFANDITSPSSIRPDVDFGIESLPSHGSLEYFNGTTWTYSPNTGFHGTDSFQYKLTFKINNIPDIVEYGTVHITVNERPQRIINQHACESYTWSLTGQNYTQTGQYQYVKPNPNGCDSLLVLNLTIHHPTEQTLPEEVACDHFTWYGTTYTQTGIYDHVTTDQWGCTLTEHLPLTIHYGDTTELAVSACESYTWNGQTYTTGGDKFHTTTNQFGCSRLEILHLTISTDFRSVEYVTECEEYTWPRNNHHYTASEIDSIVIQGAPGSCDSTFVLDLTINHETENTLESVEACDSYTWYGNTYTQSGTYSHESTNQWGCLHTDYLPLTIHQSTTQTLEPITVCDEFVWHGVTYTTSGNIQYDTVNQWGCPHVITLPLTITHSDTLDYQPVTECDSYLWNGQTITETGSYTQMTTNPDGCSRLERIFVTINHSVIDTLAPVSECDEYEWHGVTYTTSGYKEYHLDEGPTGCPYTEILPLTINHSSEYEFNITACESYEWYGETYTEGGDYYHVLGNYQGCDSVLIMHLTIGDQFEHEESVIGCNNYEWFGTVYDQSGDYTHWIENPSGCDSLFTLHLTIAQTDETEFTDESCYSYTWGLESYNQSGDYEQVFTNQMGCDSIVTLHLTVNQAVYSDFDQQTCQPFVWNGITYYEDGDYEQTLTAHTGCDSIVTMHLVFSEALTSEFDLTSCQPITWNEYYCDHDGDYEHTYMSQQGCDSIVTMHFSLGDAITTDFDYVSCQPITWNGQYCDHNGDYEHTYMSQQGCDSIVTMHFSLGDAIMTNFDQISCLPITWNEIYCDHSGDYQSTFPSLQGCDSIVTMHFTLESDPVMESSTHTACDSVQFNGLWYYDDFVINDTVFTEQGCADTIFVIHYNVRNSMNSNMIQGQSNVYAATNLIPGIYHYAIDTADVVAGHCQWTLSNPDWMIVDAQDVNCSIYVPVSGTGILSASFITTSCGENTRSIFINAQYYGVEEYNSVKAEVYPNPTKGLVTVEAEGMEVVRVVDMLGQVIERREVNDDHIVINLGGLSPAMYMIEITTEYGKAVKRIAVCDR